MEETVKTLADTLDKALQPIMDKLNTLKNPEPPKKDPDPKDELSKGVQQFIEYQNSGRLEGKSLTKKDEALDNHKPNNNQEGRLI